MAGGKYLWIYATRLWVMGACQSGSFSTSPPASLPMHFHMSMPSVPSEPTEHPEAYVATFRSRDQIGRLCKTRYVSVEVAMCT